MQQADHNADGTIAFSQLAQGSTTLPDGTVVPASHYGPWNSAAARAGISDQVYGGSSGPGIKDMPGMSGNQYAVGRWVSGSWQPETRPAVLAAWAEQLGVPVDHLVEPLDAPLGNPANGWTTSKPLLDAAIPVPAADPVPLVTHPVATAPEPAPVEAPAPAIQTPRHDAPVPAPVSAHPAPPAPAPVIPPIEVHVHLPQPVARVVEPPPAPPALPRVTEPVSPAYHNAILAVLERWMADVRHWL